MIVQDNPNIILKVLIRSYQVKLAKTKFPDVPLSEMAPFRRTGLQHWHWKLEVD